MNILFCAASVEAEDMVPLALVVESVENSEQYSDDDFIRKVYISGYVSYVRKYLQFGSERSLPTTAFSECVTRRGELGVARLCGMVGAQKSIANLVKKVSLSDFGYNEIQLIGFVKTKEKNFLLEVNNQIDWLLIGRQSELSRLKAGCYKITGFLSPDGSYGPPWDEYKKEFVLKSFVKASKDCVSTADQLRSSD